MKDETFIVLTIDSKHVYKAPINPDINTSDVFDDLCNWYSKSKYESPVFLMTFMQHVLTPETEEEIATFRRVYDECMSKGYNEYNEFLDYRNIKDLTIGSSIQYVRNIETKVQGKYRFETLYDYNDKGDPIPVICRRELSDYQQSMNKFKNGDYVKIITPCEPDENLWVVTKQDCQFYNKSIYWENKYRLSNRKTGEVIVKHESDLMLAGRMLNSIIDE